MESQNLLTMPERAYKAIRVKAVGPLYNLSDLNSRNGVKLGKHAYGSYLLNENPRHRRWLEDANAGRR